jgi:outer membrane protein assembly factor BamD (BamD/ComL family)
MRKRLVLWSVVCVAGSCAGSAWAQVRVVDGPAVPGPTRDGAEAAPAPEDPEAVVMRDARRAIVEGKPGRAKRALDDWIERFEGTEHPRFGEALYLRGNAQLAMDEEYDALYDYERLVREYPGSEFFASALERELDVAKLYLNGRRKPGIFGWRLDSGVPIAEEIVVRIAERLPGSKLAERALLELADHYARARDLRMAVETYDVFIRLFPRSPMRANAMQRRIYATVAQFKGPRYDVRMLKDAQVQIEDFAAEFPGEAQRTGLNDGLVARLDESAAAGLLTQANWYLDRDDPVSARLTLVRLVRRHPKTGAAHEALAVIERIDAEEPGIARAKGAAGEEAAGEGAR